MVSICGPVSGLAAFCGVGYLRLIMSSASCVDIVYFDLVESWAPTNPPKLSLTSLRGLRYMTS